MFNDPLRHDVAEALRHEPRVDDRAIAVAADDDEVTLRGTVGSFRERREAVHATKRVPGVEKVHDRLRVRLLDAGRRNDADLRGAVLQALMLDSLVPSTIDARAKDGIVSLTGWAPYNYQRDAAMLVAGNVPGVIDLEDHVELSIGAPTPADVRHYVNKAFTRDARVDAEALSIETDENVVTLSGHARSWVEHDAAINAAWSAPGVVDVVDRIVVEA
jgi:osmotically-inducible protein OsmY